MYHLLQAGLRYLETYPNRKKLALFMPDYHLLRLVRFSNKAMPAFACFAILWQYFFQDPEQAIMANAVVTALFALSIPFQGLFWLGKRAKSPLPLSLVKWYEELRQKLISEQQNVEEQSMPTYQDFANLLQLAEKTWGDEYFNEL